MFNQSEILPLRMSEYQNSKKKIRKKFPKISRQSPIKKPPSYELENIWDKNNLADFEDLHKIPPLLKALILTPKASNILQLVLENQ